MPQWQRHSALRLPLTLPLLRVPLLAVVPVPVAEIKLIHPPQGRA